MCVVVYILIYIKSTESVQCMSKFKVMRYELRARNTHKVSPTQNGIQVDDGHGMIASSVKVRLDQVTALVRGGLVHLDGTKNPDEPELPFTAIEAENSILSTANRDVPLFRLDRNDQGDDFIDRIHWAGRKVAYDRIQIYRVDEVHQTAVAPKIYNRANWSTAFLPTDESPILGDVKFVRETDPSHSAWKIDRDDFKLAPGSPIAATGPDLGRIPAAPPEGEL